MRKKLIFLLLAFCTSCLHARQITFIKSNSAKDINQLNYLAYKTKKNDNTIIDFQKGILVFNNKTKATFTIKDTDTHLAFIFYNADETKCIATGYKELTPGANPLKYIVHYNKEAKLILLIPSH